MIRKDGSEKIRERALRDYVEPALRTRQNRITIRVKELMQKLESEGFPRNRPAQFCSALQKRSFLRENGLVIDRIEGPPSGRSTTVVLHLRRQEAAPEASQATDHLVEETPQERAHRIVNSLRGLLKDEIAAYGGAEGFIRWVRSHEQE
jgi:hypothetical protein